MGIPLKKVCDSLLAFPGCETVTAADIDEFIGRDGPGIVFLPGDTEQRPEGEDVAVVLRELVRRPGGAPVRIGIVARRDELRVMARLGVVMLPALVLVRDGAVQEIVARMREWPVYQQVFGRLLGTDRAAAQA